MVILLLSCQTAGPSDKNPAAPETAQVREDQKKPTESNADNSIAAPMTGPADETLNRLADQQDRAESAAFTVSDLPVLIPDSSQFITVYQITDYPAPVRKDSDRLTEQGYEPVINDFSNYITSNDINPNEPDHYYLRKKPPSDRKEAADAESNDESAGKSAPAVLKIQETETEASGAPSAAKFRPESADRISSADRTASGEKSSGGETPNPPDFEIRAVEGETIQLSMTELDWIFDRNNSSSNGVSFEETQYLQNSKEFLFTALEAGKWILSFARTNLETGATETRRVAVIVYSPRDGVTGTEKAGETEGMENAFVEETERDSVHREFIGSFSADALREGLSNRNEAVLGRQLELLTGYLRADPAAIGDTGVAKAAGAVNTGLEIQEPPWTEVLDAAEQLENSSYEEAAISALKLFIDHAAGRFDETGRVYYLLGSLYESPILPRDERTAVDYYKKVLDIFPSDIYYFRAEERIKYLERHFIQIR